MRTIEEFYLAADGDDWAPAWKRAMDTCRSDSPYLGCELRFGSRDYRFRSSIDVTRRMIIAGEGPVNTRLIFQECAGIYFRYSNDHPTHPRPGNGSQSSTLRDLSIKYQGPYTDVPAHIGLYIEAKLSMHNLEISHFPGDGVSIYGDAEVERQTNADKCLAVNVRSYQNRGNGWTLRGTTANWGVYSMIDGTNNAGWGVYDESFLGNTYLSPHTANNALGSYYAHSVGDTNNQKGTFFCPYAEKDQPPSRVVLPNLVVNPIGAQAGNAARVDVVSHGLRLTQTSWAIGTTETRIGHVSGQAISAKDTRDTFWIALKREDDSRWHWLSANSVNRSVLSFAADTVGPLLSEVGLRAEATDPPACRRVTFLPRADRAVPGDVVEIIDALARTRRSFICVETAGVRTWEPLA